MSLFSHKKKTINPDVISNAIDKVNEYLKNNYIIPEPPAKPSIPSDDGHKYSISDREVEDFPEIRYSTARGVKYQFRDTDNYDSKSVSGIMQDVTRSSPTDVLNKLGQSTNATFVDEIITYINEKHLRDSYVYKAAQIDRRLFSKMISDRYYKPAKDTCIALALALNLTLVQTNDLLSRAGYVLSHSTKRDVVIEYFFREGIYDLEEINAILYKLEMKIIGR